MPGGVRWEPSKEPFSYTKLCFYHLPGLLVLLGVVALLMWSFGRLQWLDQLGNWFPSSTLLRIAIGVVLITGYYLFFTKIVWPLLPTSIRDRIPYDSQEAMESKGDIRSFWDLRKLVLRTRD